jgi:hypothetical protein
MITKLIQDLRICRKQALENMPSNEAIGRAFCAGKHEQANRDALHREFKRGQIDAYDKILVLLESEERAS